MKIGIGPYYISKYGFKEGGERMLSHGFDYLDLSWYADTEHELYANTGKDFICDCHIWRDKLTRGGIKINQVHGPWRCPAKDDTVEYRAERFEKMSRAIIATGILGAKYIALHPIMPFGTDSPDYPEEQFRMNIEFFGNLAKVAEDNDVIVCLENMPFVNLPTSSITAILRIVKEVNHPNLKVCLDTGHANIVPPAPADAVRLIGKDLLMMLHVHDNLGQLDHHLLPFEGTIDWDDFAAALKEIEFDGVISLETDVNASVKDESQREELELDLANRAKKLYKNFQ